MAKIGSDVVNLDKDCSHLSPCNDREANSRILLYVRHAVLNGLIVSCIRTVDANVVVMTVSFYNNL